MAKDFKFFEGRLPNRIYISKAFEPFYDEGEKARFITKVFDSDEVHQFALLKNQIVLRVTPGNRQEVKALFYEDDRNIESLTIQRFTKKTGKPHKWHFTFRGEELDKLYNLLAVIKNLRLEKTDKVRFDEDILSDLRVEDEAKRRFILKNQEILRDVIENNLTDFDVVGLAYRKNQLAIFDRLLSDESFFTSMQKKWDVRGREGVWQTYFEKNPWIFGYGLNYIFTTPLDNKKLEQVISSYSFSQYGKRVDALMKTRGVISSLCFVEIKHDKTDLLHSKPYRKGCWQISSDMSGSVAQIHKTVQNAINQIHSKPDLFDEMGDPTGEEVYLYQPKSYVVIGSLTEFLGDYGINEEKFSSFEIFRRNISNPEIITFDELYDRAKFIVHHSEGSVQEETDELAILDDDLPF